MRAISILIVLLSFILAAFGRNHNARLKLIIGTIIVVAIWRYFALTAFKLPEEYTYSTTDCRIESIAWCCLLAVVFDGYQGAKKRLYFLLAGNGLRWV